MKKARMFRLGFTVLLVFGLTTVCSAGTTRWKMATSWPQGTILEAAAEQFADSVTAMSGGRLTVKTYAAGVLMGALEVMDGVQSGSIDMAHSSPAYQMGKLKASPLFGYIPFGMNVIPYLTWFYEDEARISIRNSTPNTTWATPRSAASCPRRTWPGPTSRFAPWTISRA